MGVEATAREATLPHPGNERQPMTRRTRPVSWIKAALKAFAAFPASAQERDAPVERRALTFVYTAGITMPSAGEYRRP